MKHFIFLFFFGCTLISTSATGQSDSLNIVKAKWKVQRIAPGVKWKQYWFHNNLFSSNQNINILEIKLRRKTFLDLGFEPKELKPTSGFGREANAIATLNGTFFDMRNGGSVDFIKSDGEVININKESENGGRRSHQKAAVVFRNGKISIAKWDGTEDWEMKLNGEDVMVSGPLLLANAAEEALDSSGFNVTRHPRTAVAITKKNRVLLITVDGRSSNAAGMSMFELQDVLRWLHVSDGLNLDGGGSTTLWIRGKPETGVVNYPADNRTWDHAGEREVANVLLVTRKKKH